MQTSFIIGLIAAIATLFEAAFAKPLSAADIEDRMVANATFIGTVEGHTFELQGTASQVIDQLETTYPGITDRLSSRAYAPTAPETRNKVTPLCIPVKGQSWDRGYYDAVNAGMWELKAALGEHGMIRIAGKTCNTLSCRYLNMVSNGMVHPVPIPWGATQIILCNDRPDTIQPNGAYIISYAQDLVNQCTYKDQVPYWETGGQAFDNDGYNVIAKWTSEGCRI